MRVLLGFHQRRARALGTGDHRPEAGQDQLIAFPEGLGHPEIAAELARARPIGEPRLWRNLGHQRLETIPFHPGLEARKDDRRTHTYEGDRLVSLAP